MRIEDRAIALTDRLGRYEITTTTADDLGALSATGACAAPPHTVPEPGALDPAPPRVTVPPRDDGDAEHVPTAPAPGTAEATAVDSPGRVTSAIPTGRVRPEVSPVDPAELEPSPVAEAPVEAQRRPRHTDPPPAGRPLLDLPPSIESRTVATG